MNLTLEDIAVLYEIDDADVPAETVQHLKEWVRTDPQFRPSVRTLRRLADGAGLREDHPYRLRNVTAMKAELDQLLDAPSWDHPAEVLDPDGERGQEYESLLKFAEARSGEDERIQGVLSRLQQAVEQERRNRQTVAGLVEALLEQPPAMARRMLHEVAVAVERARA